MTPVGTKLSYDMDVLNQLSYKAHVVVVSLGPEDFAPRQERNDRIANSKSPLPEYQRILIVSSWISTRPAVRLLVRQDYMTFSPRSGRKATQSDFAITSRPAIPIVMPPCCHAATIPRHRNTSFNLPVCQTASGHRR